MATLLTGYRRKPGKSRRYLTPSGREISYREYRKRAADAGQTRKLDLATLANVRRKRRNFQDDIEQIYSVQRRQLENRLEIAEAQKQDALTAALKKQRRTLRREIIQSGTRKRALEILHESAHEMKNGHRNANYDPEATKLALKMLGRREDIPDWVEVGASDAFRRGRFVQQAA